MVNILLEGYDINAPYLRRTGTDYMPKRVDFTVVLPIKTLGEVEVFTPPLPSAYAKPACPNA